MLSSVILFKPEQYYHCYLVESACSSIEGASPFDFYLNELLRANWLKLMMVGIVGYGFKDIL